MEENKSLFRKESCDNLSDPDQLNEYVKVVSTPVWIILIGVIVIFAGVLVWASTAVLEKKMPVIIDVTSKGSFILFPAVSIEDIYCGQNVRQKGSTSTYEIEDIYVIPQSKWMNDDLADYTDLLSGEWYYTAGISDTGLDPGYYEGYVVMDTYHPISFLIQ